MALRRSRLPLAHGGFGLIEAMVAVAVFAVFALIINTYLLNANRVNAQYELIQDEELVRKYIRANLNCEATFAKLRASDCGPGASRYVHAYATDGSILASPDGRTKVGAYNLRVSCPRSKDRLFVEAQRTVAPDSDKVATEPLYRTLATWHDPFNGIPPFVESARPKLLDFETIPGARERLLINDEINAHLKAQYGVWFRSGSGGSLALARIARERESRPSFEAWWSVLCPKRPKRNRLCFGGDGGRWILTTTQATDTKHISFDIFYAHPVKSLSFDLADLDGGESWSFTLYDSAGQVLPNTNTQSARGYGGGTGNSALTRISLSSTTSEIARVHASGSKGIRIFGFGFDNFETGIPACATW